MILLHADSPSAIFDGLTGGFSKASVIERVIVHCPNRSLCTVVDPNLSKNRLDVNLHVASDTVILRCDGLVGISIDQTAQDGLLAGRQLRRIAALGSWRPFIRFNFASNYFTVFTTDIIVIRVSVATCAVVAAAGLPFIDEITAVPTLSARGAITI